MLNRTNIPSLGYELTKNYYSGFSDNWLYKDSLMINMSKLSYKFLISIVHTSRNEVGGNFHAEI